MNHRWDIKNQKRRSRDSGTTFCTRCGLIRQYVGGIATYYDEKSQSVTDRIAPRCKRILNHNQ